MSELPRLRVRSLLFGDSSEEIEIDQLEKLRSHFNAGAETLVVVDGQIVNSYDELARLVAQEQRKGKETVEVMLLPLIEGG